MGKATIKTLATDMVVIYPGYQNFNINLDPPQLTFLMSQPQGDLLVRAWNKVRSQLFNAEDAGPLNWIFEKGMIGATFFSKITWEKRPLRHLPPIW